MSTIRWIAKKSNKLIIAYHILDNYRYKLGIRKKSHFRVRNLKESIAYIEKVFNEYFLYSGLPIEYIRGKNILELGPGDNFGVALKFLTYGANKVFCIDKFYSKRDLFHEYLIYKEMRNKVPPPFKKNFENSIKFYDNKFKFVGKKFKYICGKGIEETLNLLPHSYFDLIVSRAVMEHLYDVDKAFCVMDKLIKPGGYMIHNIDFRDHGIFTTAEKHPLTFLTISHRIWKLMTYYSGKPNRMLVDYYRKKMHSLNYKFEIKVQRVIGYENELPYNDKVSKYFQISFPLIEEIRESLQPEFKKLSNKDLMIASIFLISHKPEYGEAGTRHIQCRKGLPALI